MRLPSTTLFKPLMKIPAVLFLPMMLDSPWAWPPTVVPFAPSRYAPYWFPCNVVSVVPTPSQLPTSTSLFELDENTGSLTQIGSAGSLSKTGDADPLDRAAG